MESGLLLNNRGTQQATCYLVFELLFKNNNFSRMSKY